jgi:hypothetical protein
MLFRKGITSVAALGRNARTRGFMGQCVALKWSIPPPDR